MTAHRRRRTIIPEVVQISATDCGPASLKSMFAGMGAELNYRVLREVCQTDIDGTSIVTLDEVANQLGLDAEEVMLPVDHVFLPEARALPAIIVVLTAGGRPHFIVLWKRVGPFVQIMDPAAGRLWVRVETLLGNLYQHTTSVPAEGWREWAGSEEAVATLARRLRNLGVDDARALIDKALADPGHQAIATLDAACRATEAMVRAGAVKRGRTAASLLASMIAKAESGDVAIPAPYWSVRPNPEAPGELLLSGAVLMRVRGWREDAPPAGDGEPAAPKSTLAPEIASEIVAKQPSAARALFRLLREDPRSIPILVTAGLVIATFGRVLQALMLRAVLDLGRDLSTVGQRATGILVFAAVALFLLLIQIPISLGLLGIGRRLEVRLRKAYFEQLPKTEDRYFQSRLASDMASRTVDAVEKNVADIRLAQEQRAKMLEIYRSVSLDVYDRVVDVVAREDLEDEVKEARVRELVLEGQRTSHARLESVLDSRQLGLYSAWETRQVEAFKSRRWDRKNRRRR
jgi:hypothetical protein